MSKQKTRQLDAFELLDVLEEVRDILAFPDVDDNDYIATRLRNMLQIEVGNSEEIIETSSFRASGTIGS